MKKVALKMWERIFEQICQTNKICLIWKANMTSNYDQAKASKYDKQI